MNLRCGFYARISPTPDTGVGANYSIASQLRALRERARSKTYDVVGEFVDDNVTGELLDRPALNQLRELVRATAIDVLLCYSLDRFGRNTAHLLLLRDECAKAGVRLEFINTEFEQSPEGKLMFGVSSIIAEYEREKIKERTVRGAREKVQQGFIQGGRGPFGYAYIGRSQGKRGELIVDEQEAAIVRRIFDAAVAGESPRDIALALNAEGIAPRRASQWSKEVVNVILRNRSYRGEWFWNKHQGAEPARRRKPARPGVVRTSRRRRAKDEWLRVNIPPIIDQATWDRAQAALDATRQATNGRPARCRQYLLRGLVRCQRCGRPLYAYPNRNRPYLRCGNFDRLTGERYCDAARVWAQPLEDWAWKTAVATLSDPVGLEQALGERERQKPTERRERTRLEGLIARLRKRESQATRMLLDPDLDDTWDTVRRELKAAIHQRRELERQLETLTPAPRGILDRSDLDQLCLEFRRKARNANFATKRDVLEAWVRAIRVDGENWEMEVTAPNVHSTDATKRKDGQAPIFGLLQGLILKRRIA